MNVRRNNRRAIGNGLLVLVVLATTVQAQQKPRGRYFPLDQNTPPGIIAQWHSLSAGTTIGAPQAVQVVLPDGGTVGFYDSSAARVHMQPSPAQAKLAVGHLYRLHISELPDYPGVELYPTIEILDQLHPPAGMEDRYPVPIAITKEEIQNALRGNMVTKVVYLEQPRDAVGRNAVLEEAVKDIPNRMNALAEADRLGRPMLVLRLGSRTPSPNAPNHDFYGTGGPVLPSFVYAAPIQSNKSQNKLKSGFVRLRKKRSTPVAGL